MEVGDIRISGHSPCPQGAFHLKERWTTKLAITEFIISVTKAQKRPIPLRWRGARKFPTSEAPEVDLGGERKQLHQKCKTENVEHIKCE